MLREGKDRKERKRLSQAISPLATMGRLSCVHHPPQTRLSRKGKLHAPFGHGSQLPELFLPVGDCENQAGIDRLINDRRYNPTVRPWNRMRRASFFHGSTDVRVSSLSGSFSEHPATQHAGLCFRLSSAMSTAWSLAFFRRVCRADQAVAHAIELDLDERPFDESSIGHLVGLPSL
jgi:hypothetical protein